MQRPFVMTATLLFVALAWCARGYASNSDLEFSQYDHTAWTEREGAPRGILAIAQTRDGYLWLAGSEGLFRFDGVIFERYEPESGSSLPSGNAQSLLDLANGDLWVGYHSGAITRLRDGRANTYTRSTGAAKGDVWCLAQDREGTLWAGGTGGLRRFVQNRWEEVGSEWNLPGNSVRSLFVDHSGTLWVATEDTIAFLPGGARKFQPTSIPVGQVGHIVESPQGKLWMAETTRSVRPVPLGNKARPSDRSEIRFGSQQILFDSEGSLWITTDGDGVRHLSASEYLQENSSRPRTAFEGFTMADGLTNDVVTSIFQDRDGNIWTGTPSGLDRFRKRIFQSIQLPVTHEDVILTPGSAGDVWAFLRSRTFHIAHSRTQEINGFKPTYIYSAFRNPAGVMWVVSFMNVSRVENGRWTSYPLPEEFGTNWSGAAYVAEDRSGVLWLAAEREGLFRRENGSWRRFDTPRELVTSVPTAAFTDESGRVWFGYSGGALINVEDGRLQMISSRVNSSGADVCAIDGRGGTIWIGGGSGLAFFDGHTLNTVTPSDQMSFGRILGVKQAAGGSLWLYRFNGIVRIGAAEVRKVLAAPSYRVHYEIYDSPGKFIRGAGQKLVESTDGRLWFGATDHVDWLNPESLPKQAPFSISIRAVSADGRQYPFRANPTIPPQPRRIEIDYTGLNLSNPERVRYRYKLEGTDTEWQDAGARREAFYTDLGPGKHRFEVDARNEGGEWSTPSTVVEFTIAPAWFQTIWFRGLCVGISALILVTIFQLRSRQLERRFQLTLEARLDERTRIARELHDTLLQSFQGAVFQFQAGRKLLLRNADNAMQVVDEAIQAAEEGITEGRAAIRDLRPEPAAQRDLPELLNAVGRELARAHEQNGNVPSYRVVFEGKQQDLSPMLQDEVYRISREVIRNAFAHAAASLIEVEIRYDQDQLRLRVRDDGKGIDPKVLEAGGRSGHFGIPGMRERAERIGARLDFWSEMGAGTEVELTVPASMAYEKRRNGRRFGMFRRATDDE